MLLYNLQNYYPNTVSIDPSLVCIVINRSIRVPPPHLGNAFTAHNYYSPLSRMSRTPVFIINPHLLTPSDTGK